MRQQKVTGYSYSLELIVRSTWILPTIALLFEVTKCYRLGEEQEKLIQHRINREQIASNYWSHWTHCYFALYQIILFYSLLTALSDLKQQGYGLKHSRLLLETGMNHEVDPCQLHLWGSRAKLHIAIQPLWLYSHCQLRANVTLFTRHIFWGPLLRSLSNTANYNLHWTQALACQWLIWKIRPAKCSFN